MYTQITQSIKILSHGSEIWHDLNSQLKMKKIGSLQIVKNIALLAARNRIPFGIFYAKLGLPVI